MEIRSHNCRVGLQLTCGMSHQLGLSAILTAGWWFFVECMYVNMNVKKIQNDKLGRRFFCSKIKQQKMLFEGAQGFVARSTWPHYEISTLYVAHCRLQTSWSKLCRKLGRKRCGMCTHSWGEGSSHTRHIHPTINTVVCPLNGGLPPAWKESHLKCERKGKVKKTIVEPMTEP